MKPWYTNAALPDGSAATHVLVIACSRYLHLPDGKKPRTNFDFDLRQLQTAVLGSFSFVKWMRGDYHNPSAPLGTIRLAFSPSRGECEGDADLDAVCQSVPEATTENVKNAVFAWLDDCNTNKDNLAIFASNQRMTLFPLHIVIGAHTGACGKIPRYS